VPGYLLNNASIRAQLAQAQADIAALQAKTSIYAVAHARVTTNGAGGFTVNEARGMTVSLSGTRIRLTFSTARPTISGNPHYNVSVVQIGTGVRTDTITGHTATTCDLVIRDGAGELNLATSVQAMIITVTDFDV
jgi:hypothetical protein